MARRRSVGRAKGGGLIRMAERTGVNRGLFGGSKGWLYVGTGLWTLRKVRSLGERKTEILLVEKLQPGQRIVIANDRATIEGQVDAQIDGTGTGGRRRRRRSR